ncbi:GNAT family N-acetyltransferase [bacterium]|nr:GNAT family N-acetyltransferase [bacterium]MCI0607083.1 GNAT family N-acetyltransferase [bacterium]
MEYRFLDDFDLIDLHPIFLRAFSDYFVPMNLTRDQFSELLTRRGGQKELSVAAFQEDEPVGFTINAFDHYQGIPTIYDVATGIVPEARRKGIAQGIFEFSLSRLKGTGATRYVLEVFAKNSAAFTLYKKTGFSVERDLEIFSGPKEAQSRQSSFTIKTIEPMWELFERFWDWHPSWQNSISSIQRSKMPKILLGIFSGSQLIGYGIVFPDTGDIPQFAIQHDHRKQGAGAALLAALQTHVQPGRSARIGNVDGSATGTITFLRRIGFEWSSAQYEMQMNFSETLDTS